MEVISRCGDPDLAEVFVAKFRGKRDLLAEFVDARDPEVSSDKKWIIILSTQFGCPVACTMCDAGGRYLGNLTADEMISQIDHIVSRYPASRLRSIEKFKIQFARMGEPSLNHAVLDALCALSLRYNTPALMPCVATIGPAASASWFDELLTIRHTVYGSRQFQLQFSINSTDEAARDRLMPVAKMSLKQIGEYTDSFHLPGMRKVALNFALAEGIPVDASIVAKHFNPRSSCVKITPLNPTARSIETDLRTALPPDAPAQALALCDEFRRKGFDVILSIGDERENMIGSNCGMAVRKWQNIH